MDGLRPTLLSPHPALSLWERESIVIKTRHPSWLPLRHRAEAASAGLPDLIAAAEKAAATVLSGDHRQRRPGMGERFWQFREYDPSDRPQDIDWRQSGKGDRVFVRQKEWQTAQTVLFWLQGTKGMRYRSTHALPEKRTEGIVLALALSLMLNRRGELTGLLDNGHRPGRNAPSLQMFAEDLMRDNGTALPHPAIQRIPAHASLILIGDFLSDTEEIRRTLDALAARAPNGVMVQVLDPAEIALPFSGRVIFEETDGMQDHHVLSVDDVRAEYIQRMENHMEALRLMCRRHRWQWVLHRTDSDITETLFALWRIIASDTARGSSS